MADAEVEAARIAMLRYRGYVGSYTTARIPKLPGDSIAIIPVGPKQQSYSRTTPEPSALQCQEATILDSRQIPRLMPHVSVVVTSPIISVSRSVPLSSSYLDELEVACALIPPSSQ